MEFIQIAQTIDQAEAVAWKSLLVSAGFTVRLSPEADAFRIYPGAADFETYRLYVVKDEALEAFQALEKIRNESEFEYDYESKNEE